MPLNRQSDARKRLFFFKYINQVYHLKFVFIISSVKLPMKGI